MSWDGDWLFFVTVGEISLTFLVPSVVLLLQFYGRNISKWLGGDMKGFLFHATVELSLWLIFTALIVCLNAIYWKGRPVFFTDIWWLQFIIGPFLVFVGGVAATYAYMQLGLKQSLCLNFFLEDLPINTSWIYRYLFEPQEFGFWLMMLGLAILTTSWYNLIITLEFVVCMSLFMLVENLPVRKKRRTKKGNGDGEKERLVH